MALITLRDISLAFGGPPLFDGINLQRATKGQGYVAQGNQSHIKLLSYAIQSA